MGDGSARRICFVAPQAYAVLAADRQVRTVGGAEVQQVFIARELVRRGYEVSMICLDYGQADELCIDGIRVLKAHAPDAGLPVLRFFHPRLSSIWRAMLKADADVYYQRAASALSGFVVAFARRHRRLSVLASASDMDFVPDLPWIPLRRDKALYRWAAKNADAIVVQTEVQQRACQQTFGRSPLQINSCYGHVGRSAAHDGPVIWVGSVKPLKQPEHFVELARATPGRQFRMIGGGSEADVQGVLRASAGLNNFEYVGFVPFADIEKEFDGASVLVNTSVSEGFPNTFLQAWSRGMPSLSYFNAGATVDGVAVGVQATDPADMALKLRSLDGSLSHWTEVGANCKRYFDAKLGVGVAVDAYEALFADLARRASR